MNFRQLIDDNDAVSPVIGVILMVAITVILAAVIGTFVLGLGDQVSNTSPTASFTFDQGTADFTDGTSTTSTLTQVTITHDGGDPISESNLEVLVNGDRAINIDPYAPSGTATDDKFYAPYNTTNDQTAGSSVHIEGVYTGTNFDGEDDTANLNYDGSGGFGSGAPARALSSEDAIRVVWTSSNGGDSATLGRTTVN